MKNFFDAPRRHAKVLSERPDRRRSNHSQMIKNGKETVNSLIQLPGRWVFKDPSDHSLRHNIIRLSTLSGSSSQRLSHRLWGCSIREMRSHWPREWLGHFNSLHERNATRESKVAQRTAESHYQAKQLPGADAGIIPGAGPQAPAHRAAPARRPAATDFRGPVSLESSSVPGEARCTATGVSRHDP